MPSRNPNSDIERQRRAVKALAEDLEKLATARQGAFPPGGEKVFEALSRGMRESGLGVTKLTAGLLANKEALKGIGDAIQRVNKAKEGETPHD